MESSHSGMTMTRTLTQSGNNVAEYERVGNPILGSNYLPELIAKAEHKFYDTYLGPSLLCQIRFGN